MIPEFLLNLRRTRHEAVHKLRVEQIAVCNAVLDNTALYGLVEQIFQNVRKNDVVQITGHVLVIILMHQVEQKIRRIDPFTFRCQAGVDPVLYQFLD